jgi:tetratricopeptide (TPR) repeat protein
MAGRLIDQLRSRNFILCDRGGDTYGFVHRTFLEYFCATEIVRRFEKERSLSEKQLRDDVFGQHWEDKAWHEVLRLICGLLEPKWAGKLVEFLMEREVDRADYLDDSDYLYGEKLATKKAVQHLQLAAECLAEVRNPQSIGSIATTLKEKLKNAILSESEIALNDEAKELIINSIGQYYHTAPETLTWLQNIALSDEDPSVRGAAVRSIGQYYHTQPEILTWLEGIYYVSSVGSVIATAMESIGKYYHTYPGTLQYLTGMAISAYHRSVKATAMVSIARYYHTYPETLECLQDIALSAYDRDGSVGSMAVASICQHYHTYPETLQYLQNIALSAYDERVQPAAMESIGKYYYTQLEILTWLHNTALSDENSSVRTAAVNSIGIYYHTQSETLTWLHDITLSDENSFVREKAVNSIGKYYHTYPETLQCLQNIALSTNDLEVRQEAMESIGKYYHTAPETLEWLQNIALSDENSFVRAAAVNSIGQYYHTTPESLDWILENQHTPEVLNWIIQNIYLCDLDKSLQGSVESSGKCCIQVDDGFEFLCGIVSQDIYQGSDYFSPRKTALEGLVNHYSDRPEIIELLRDRSTQDPNEELQKWAEEQLEKIVRSTNL